MSDLRFI